MSGRLTARSIERAVLTGIDAVGDLPSLLDAIILSLPRVCREQIGLIEQLSGQTVCSIEVRYRSPNQINRKEERRHARRRRVGDRRCTQSD